MSGELSQTRDLEMYDTAENEFLANEQQRLFSEAHEATVDGLKKNRQHLSSNDSREKNPAPRAHVQDEDTSGDDDDDDDRSERTLVRHASVLDKDLPRRKSRRIELEQRAPQRQVEEFGDRKFFASLPRNKMLRHRDIAACNLLGIDVKTPTDQDAYTQLLRALEHRNCTMTVDDSFVLRRRTTLRCPTMYFDGEWSDAEEDGDDKNDHDDEYGVHKDRLGLTAIRARAMLPRVEVMCSLRYVGKDVSKLEDLVVARSSFLFEPRGHARSQTIRGLLGDGETSVDDIFRRFYTVTLVLNDLNTDANKMQQVPVNVAMDAVSCKSAMSEILEEEYKKMLKCIANYCTQTPR